MLILVNGLEAPLAYAVAHDSRNVRAEPETRPGAAGSQAEAAFAVSQRERLDVAVQQLQRELHTAEDARAALVQQLAQIQTPAPAPLAAAASDPSPAVALNPPAAGDPAAPSVLVPEAAMEAARAATTTLRSQADGHDGSGGVTTVGLRPGDGSMAPDQEASAAALRDENAALRGEVEQLREAATARAAAAGLRREDLAAALDSPRRPGSPAGGSSDRKQARRRPERNGM